MSVLLNTSLGDIVIDLYTDQCPLSSKNFLKLCKIKYYNNCVFHSVQKDFIAQTGDPTGTGSGGDSIYKFLYGEQARFFNDEIHPELKHDKVGKVAMASAGDNLNASQFYITTRADLDYLDGKHTVFGEVAEGLEALMRINEAYVDEKMRPYKNIRIKHTYILEDPFEDPVQLAELIPENSPELKPAAEGEEVRLEDDWIPLDEQLDPEELEKSLRRKEAQSRAVVLEMVGDIPEAEIKPPENVLFVCKLNPITEEEDLEIIFSRFGKIISADIIRDYKTGDSLCYAFIEFETQEACEAAYFKMDNVLIDDRRIHVDFSQSVSKLWTRYRRFGKNDKDDGEGANFAPRAKGPGCFNCGEFGHFAKDCPNEKPQVQEKPKYKLKDIEGQHGHGDKRYEMVFDDTSDDPHQHGQPPEKEFRKRYPEIENVEGDTDDRSRQSSRSRKGIDSSREDDVHHKSRDSQRRSHGVDKSRHDREHRHWRRVDEAPSRGHHDSSNKRHSQRHNSEEDEHYHRHYDRDDNRRTKVHAEEDGYSHRYHDGDGKERSYREGAKEPDQSGSRKDKRHRQREDTEVDYHVHKGFDEGNKRKKHRDYSPPKDTQVRRNSDGHGGGGSKDLKDHHNSRDHGGDDRHDSLSFAGRRKDHSREEHRSHRKLEEHSRHRDASRNDLRRREN